jgi:Protein of unknown function (DUF3237)
MYGHKYELEYLCSFNTGLTPPEIIGLVAEGHRITAYHTGGQVSGPRLRGKVLPVGGDWATLRTDGLVVVDVRTTIQTDDEALLYISYGGLIDAGPEGYQMFLAGTFPPVLPIRTTPRFQTASPAYQWANRVVCVGIGELDLNVPEVRYDIYAVS